VASAAPLAGSTRVTFRDDLTFLVDGEPFFPLGLYYASEEIADVSGRALAELRQAGFNYVFYHGPPKMDELDRIAQAGLRVHYRPPGALHGLHDDLSAVIAAVRDHPALLLWEMDDEPEYNKIDLEKTRQGCAILKRHDPDHPILAVHWARTRPADLRRWGELCDVNGFNKYPVGRTSLGVMGRLTEEWQAAVPGKPVLAVLQAFAWDPLRDGRAGFPTAAQGRFMAYQTVIAGAKGLAFYGRIQVSVPATAVMLPPRIHADDPGRTRAEFEQARELNTAFWRDYLPLIRELAEMAPVFAARDADWRPTVSRGPLQWGADPIEWRVKRTDGGGWVVLLVNNSTRPCRVRIGLPRPPTGGRVHCRATGRSLPIEVSGAFEDDLEPYAVRAYADRPRATREPAETGP